MKKYQIAYTRQSGKVWIVTIHGKDKRTAAAHVARSRRGYGTQRLTFPDPIVSHVITEISEERA